MGATAITFPLLGFAAMAAACQQPAETAPAAERSAETENQGSGSSASCAAPGHWRNEVADQDPAKNVTNIVTIDKAGTIHWNGMPLDTVRLRQYMDVVATMLPTPGTAVEVDPGAPCAKIAEVVRLVGDAVECDRLCSYATGPFDRPAPPPPKI